MFQIGVANNDIYYLEDIDGKNYEQLTSDGAADVIYNGVPDWLYEGIFCYFSKFCNNNSVIFLFLN